MRIQELWSEADERLLADFARFLATDDVPGALFSLAATPSETQQSTRGQLQSWGARLASELRPGDAQAQAVQLGALLSGEVGFALDETASEDSVDLACALLRRRGHAAILATLYREVAAAAGLSAEIIALPGRLLVRIGGKAPAFVDPALGRVLGEAEARAMLLSAKGLAFDPSLLRRASAADVLGRALKFAINHHAAAGNLVELYRALSFAAALRPERPLPRLQMAAIAEQLGARTLAEETYRAVANDFPNTQESAIAASRLREARAPVLYQ